MYVYLFSRIEYLPHSQLVYRPLCKQGMPNMALLRVISTDYLLDMPSDFFSSLLWETSSAAASSSSASF